MARQLSDALHQLVAPEVKRARFGTMLQRLMGTDVSTPTPIIHPAITPVMPVDNLTQEHEFLRQVSNSMGSLSVAAGAAGNFSWVQLRANAAGMLVVVDKVWSCVSATGAIRMYLLQRIADAILPTPGTDGIDFTDSRNTGSPSAALTGANTFNSLTLGGQVLLRQRVLANVPYLWEPRVTLTQGWSLLVANETAVQDIFVAMQWRERALPDVELANG